MVRRCMVKSVDPAAPTTAAASALSVRSMPDASAKLIAACCVTPRPSRTTDVVPMLTIAPPAVIGRIDVAAARQITTKASGGEKPAPRALRSTAQPSASGVQEQCDPERPRRPATEEKAGGDERRPRDLDVISDALERSLDAIG